MSRSGPIGHEGRRGRRAGCRTISLHAADPAATAVLASRRSSRRGQPPQQGYDQQPHSCAQALATLSSGYAPAGGPDSRTARRSQAPRGHQASVHPLPFNRFPPPPEADAGRGFAPAPQPSAHQLPFNRLRQPAPEPDPTTAMPSRAPSRSRGSVFPSGAPAAAPRRRRGGQPADPRGFDLGNYMSAPGQQGYAQPEAAPFPGATRAAAVRRAAGLRRDRCRIRRDHGRWRRRSRAVAAAA